MIIVRRAREEDLSRLAEVRTAAADTAYADLLPPDAPVPTPVMLARVLQVMHRADDTDLLVASDGRSLGMMVLRDAGDTIVIEGLYVHPDGWGRGIGSRLLDHALGVASRGPGHLSLWVLAGNTAARSWYERRGWQATGATRGLSEVPGVVEEAWVRDVARPVDRPLNTPSPRRLPVTTPGREAILAAHAQAVDARQDGYLDPLTGLMSMTATGLLARGHCCGTGCRHCPWVA